MAKFRHPLNHVTIASPCSVAWDGMMGNDRRRFCSQCELNVYNLSDMSKREAEALINQSEGRLCVRFYRRADGTILTKNCPIGLRAVKQRLSRIATATLSAVLGFLSGSGLFAALQATAQDLDQPNLMGVIAERDIPAKSNVLPTREDMTEFEGMLAIEEPRTVRRNAKSRHQR